MCTIYTNASKREGSLGHNKGYDTPEGYLSARLQCSAARVYVWICSRVRPGLGLS